MVQVIKRADELSEQDMLDLEGEEKKIIRDDYDLKIETAEIHSPLKELNKDFTLSNLSDNMFDSKVVNFIMGRVYLVKLVALLFPYANKKRLSYKSKSGKLKNMEIVLEYQKINSIIKWQTYEYKKTTELILAEVYTILNMSKARGGLILRAFLQGSMSNEEIDKIVGDSGGPAITELRPRSFLDKALGRNKLEVHKI